jgi:hypothetical protein
MIPLSLVTFISLYMCFSPSIINSLTHVVICVGRNCFRLLYCINVDDEFVVFQTDSIASNFFRAFIKSTARAVSNDNDVEIPIHDLPLEEV